MSSQAHTPRGLGIAQRRRELDNLLAAGLAREHSHLYDLLVYLGTKALEEPDAPLKEYVVGVEALRKPPEYDPRLDPTVRVEVARLRKKLEDYYRGPGVDHPVRMEIPKGGYLPVFTEPAQPPLERGRRWLTLAGVAAAALAIVLLLLLGLRPGARLDRELEAFWRPWFANPHPSLLVYGTPLFIKMNRSYYRDPRINSKEEMAEQPRLARVLEALTPAETRPVFTFTGVGEAEAMFLLTRVLAGRRGSLDARPSSSLSWDDLKGRNVIFLGGRKYNSMIAGLPHKRKFEEANRAIVNLQPRAGEPAAYRTASRTPHGELTEEYALISVSSGLSSGTLMMTLDSSSTEGTLAAAEFITRPDTVRDLVKRDLSPTRPFQVVIRAKLNQGVPVGLSYVTHAVVQ